MGLFRKKKTTSTNKSLSEQQDAPIVNQRSFTKRLSGHFQQQQQPQQQPQDDASGVAVDLSMVPGWIHDLQTAKTTSGHTAARALRNLFTLSEHDTHNRSAMTRPNGQQEQQLLVPTLLDFLQRCERGSSEQYLTLLVLNNISIPAENKRVSVCVCVSCPPKKMIGTKQGGCAVNPATPLYAFTSLSQPAATKPSDSPFCVAFLSLFLSFSSIHHYVHNNKNSPLR